MPRINRIRIINFSYNDDTREIADETFDFYGGENALMNLANGGGKSVLVQLFMQPIVPDLSIQKRRMAEYLKKNSSPVFILLEWILDNPAMKDYLLTGIVIAPRASMQTEETNRINYFTFASHYDRACDLDLGYVPFIRKENNQTVLMQFEQSREEIKRLASANREIFYYGRDDASEYRKLLQAYGISQEEWKNLIAGMNNDEGGIDDLFQRCSTSDSVFNEWIIKNIEKSRMSEDSAKTGIRDLLAGLVSDTIKNEDYIKSREIIGNYLGEHNKLETEMSRLCEALEARELSKKQLNRMYQALNVKESEVETDLEALAWKKEEQAEERLHIQREKSSEKYYAAWEKIKSVQESRDLKKAEKLKSESCLEAKCYQEKCYQGAKLYKECQALTGRIDALRQQIEAKREDGDLKERLESLAYTLKLLSEEACEKSKQFLGEIEEEIRDHENAQEEWTEQLKIQEQTVNAQNKGMGILEARMGQFEQYEDRVFKELSINFRRNILKELELSEAEDFKAELFLQEGSEKQNLMGIKEGKAAAEVQLEQLSSLISDRKLKQSEERHRLERLGQELDRLCQWKEKCGELLEKYDLSRELMYSPKQCATLLLQKRKEQEKGRYESQLEEKQIEDMLKGIENHHVYIPETLLKALESQDMEYETGEAYLENLDEDKRILQLAKNPMLPFGLIIKKQGWERLTGISLKGCFLRQIVPVFFYEQLNQKISGENQIVAMGDQGNFISAYEERLFKDKSLRAYIGDLKLRIEKLREIISHKWEELAQLGEAEHVLSQGNYGKDSEKDYRRQLEEAGGLITDFEKQIKDAGELRSRIRAKLETFETDGKKAEEKLREIGRKSELLKEYLEENTGYQSDSGKFAELKKQMDQAALEKAKAEAARANSRARTREAQRKQSQMEHQYEQEKKWLGKYVDAKPKMRLTGTFLQLKPEYEQLIAGQELQVASLQRELDEKSESYRERFEELGKIEVKEEDYKQLAYDKLEHGILKKDIKELKTRDHELGLEFSDLQGDVKAAQRDLEHSQNELEGAGLSKPLEKEDIRQDYDRRLRTIRQDSERIDEQEKCLRELKLDCRSFAGRISDSMEVLHVPMESFVLEESIREQFDRLRNLYENGKSGVDKIGKQCKNLLMRIRQEYSDKNQSVADILDSLGGLRLEEEGLTYEGVYFCLEEFMKKRENLIKLLDFYDGQLETIAHTKQQVVEQCISYGHMLYEDVKLIAQKSRIRLSGKNRPVQMLKIGVPEQLDSGVLERMNQYIERSLNTMVELNKAGEDQEKKQREKLALLMSGRELINQLIGTNKISVYVYKIDLNEKNSGLKKWEDAMAQNSGGEKFVVFFTMLSTLISYIREVTRQNIGGDAMQESKVLIMDNPFARTSSEHLLKAVTDIAKTFKIQLICLSDLSQSSITNRFSLIYQLRVRKRMYSDKEVLKVEPVQKNKADLERNQELEHAAYYETGVQESLWDFV